jgi:hypothetical protein
MVMFNLSGPCGEEVIMDMLKLPGELEKRVSRTFRRDEDPAAVEQRFSSAMSRLRLSIKQLEDGQGRVQTLFRNLWERQDIRADGT